MSCAYCESSLYRQPHVWLAWLPMCLDCGYTMAGWELQLGSAFQFAWASA